MIAIHCKTVAAVTFSAAILLVSAYEALADDLESLKGKALSDPSYVFEMPDEWMNQGIKYEQWAGLK